MADPLLRVIDLKTHFRTDRGLVKAVDGISYDLQPGEVLGFVGESGCGKTVSALSVLRLIQNPPGKIVSGQVWFEGQDLLSLDEEMVRRIRGNRIAMVFQEPMTSLNPVLTIGRQLTETVELHLKMSHADAQRHAIESLEMVGIPGADRRINDYPHQFSGGMRQRVMIAMALSCNPKILLADEPTTALDVTIQAQILELMTQLAKKMGAAVIIITHNLGVIARYADRVNVMYAGRIVESGPATELYRNPRHPYTLGLLRSVPRLDDARSARLDPIEGLPPDSANMPPGCHFEPRCPFVADRCNIEYPPLIALPNNHDSACWEWKRLPQPVEEPKPELLEQAMAPVNRDQLDQRANHLVDLRNLNVHFPVTSGMVLKRTVGYVKAVNGVSLSIRKGETLGLVGESGCGKTTLGRTILMLYRPTSGQVIFEGQDMGKMKRSEIQKTRRRMQMIFQDPLASLNPRMTAGSIIEEPIIIQGSLGAKNRQRERVRELMHTVGLNPKLIDHYPHEFSSGQRQRIGIARALAVEPVFIVADEPISALDVSIQAQIINLLEELQDRFHLTYLFISHDLSVIRHISTRVAVMYLGKLMEIAGQSELYGNPLHPYTKALISAVPIPDPLVETKRERIVLSGDIPNPQHPPTGCVFNTRCPLASREHGCFDRLPEWRNAGKGQVEHWVACHRV